MICYIPGCICYGSEIFGLGSLHDDNVGLVGAPPQLYSVAQYRCDYCFGISIFFGRWDFFSINQLISVVFKSICFLFLVMCSFQFNLQSRCIPRYFTTSVWGMIVWLMLTAGQWPFRRVNVICDDLDSLTLIFNFFSHFLWCISALED